jgi:CHAD domain-containing protein
VKHQLDTFDDLRDTQVQLAAVKELARRFPDLRPFRAYLEKREARLTRPTRKKVKDLKPGRATKAIGACREELEAIRAKKSPEAAAALLQNSVRNAFERIRHLKERIDPRDSKTIHCTRVAFKKFRYMMESIAELTGSITKQRLSEMHDYQILMGDIQDSEVLLQSFDKFLCKKDLKPGAGRKFHCLLLERRELFIKKYLRHADRLYDFWPEKGKRTGKPNGASRARKTGKMPTHPTLIANPQPPKTRASSA